MKGFAGLLIIALSACPAPAPRSAEKVQEPKWTMDQWRAAFEAKEARSRQEFDRLNAAVAEQQERSREEFRQLNVAAEAKAERERREFNERASRGAP